MSRGPEPAGRSGIGSSNSRFQPRSVTALNRLAQPLHRKFDILRLQLAPALDLGLVPLFWEALEILRGQLLAAVRSLVNFSRMKGSRGIDSLPRKETAPALGELRP
jgi:hypothetical protein